MLQTTNYQLNQWEKSDRILMDDFNRDNEKLDSALQAIRDACPVVKLLDVTTEQDAAQVDLDLSGLDLTPYSNLQVEIHLAGGTSSAYCYVRCNGISSGYVRGSDTPSGLCVFNLGLTPTATVVHLMIALEEGGIVGAPIYGYWANSYNAFYSQGSNSLGAIRTVKRDTLTALNFVMSDTSERMSAESRFLVRGVKF